MNPVPPSLELAGLFLYANCLVILCSKLQSQVTLSTTEAEYIAPSQARHNIIPVISLLSEMREYNFNVISVQSWVYYKAFEDKSGALELARVLKLLLQTKHINFCYHHFHKHVRNRLIIIYPSDTQDQVDVLTKTLLQNSFCHHHVRMGGCWDLPNRMLRECYNI